MRKLFLCRHCDMWEDSWTYGDWRQYICRRPDGSLVPARHSTLPVLAAGAGLALFALACLCSWTGAAHPEMEPRWGLLIAMGSVGAALASLPLGQRLLGLALMRRVGPASRRREDGSAWRVFDHEERD